ncbi:MAG: DUF4252 domain-containing protein [Saprospiraceae bacterium]|nr:DUF4252 domain-containing protein [Saprospiraceae bacterium]
MRIFIALLATMFFTTLSYGQNNAIDKFFSAYESNENFTVVYVSPKMFEMVAKVTDDSKNADIKDLIKDIKGLKILSTKKDPQKYYTEAAKKIPIGEYEVLMTVKDKGDNVKFLTKGTGDVIDELLLLVGGADDFVLMSFVGKLDLNKISKLANKLDIEGSEHLDKLKNKK